MSKIVGIFGKQSRRLRLLKTSKTSTFTNSDKTIQCMFNGKIYNHQKLKRNLITDGYNFETDNDCELIVRLYEKHGYQFLSLLDGMFSIALRDKDKLLLSIDRFGIKPLYYFRTDNHLIFASDIRSILSRTSKHKLSKQALSSYFKYRFIAHPLTIFDDVHKLSPKTLLIYQNGVFQIKKYKVIKIRPNATNIHQNIKDYENSQTGIFLSGGLDSSILNCGLSKPVHAFTINYECSHDTDETFYAKTVAKQCGSVHHIITLRNKDILRTLNSCVVALEEPLYSTVAISTYFLSQNAKKYVKNIICGDGADELFLGYQYIRTAMNNSGDEIKTYRQQIAWLQNDIVDNIFIDKSIINKLNFIKKNKDPLSEIVNFERRYRLPDYHLSRLEKLTGDNSLESRLPYLNNNVYDYVSKYKYSELLTEPAKKLLIDEFRQCVPKVILNRKKQPFTTPFTKWIDSCLYSDIYKLFKNKKLCEKVNINSSELVKILEKNDKHYFDYTAIWGCYTLLKWLKYYKKYIKRSHL